MERKGFHVPCNTDLDCFSRCGSTMHFKPTHALTTLAVNQRASFVPGHPVTGMHYVCTHNVQLYSQAGFDKSAYEDQLVANRQLKREGEPHPKIWLPDSNNEDFYMLDMPGIALRISSTLPILATSHAFPNIFIGDDKYDIQFGTGVCTDTHYDYLHTGCDSIEASRATMAVVGCPTKAYINSNYLCGVLIDIDEDYVHSVGISAISLIYPRTLVEEARINGITQQRITCWNQFDCADKCDSMARKQHSGGLPAPPACALCNPPCPNNVAETIVGAIRALGQDITTALRLAALCLNPVACVCQVFMLLRPAWIDNLPNELQECSAPDIMNMILDKVAVALLGLLETIMNNAFIDPLNRIFKSIKRVEIDFSPFGKVKPFDFINTIGRLCIPYKDIKDCRSEAELAELAALLGCSWDDKSLWKRCYYERVRHAPCTDRLRNGTHTLSTPFSRVAGQVHLPGRRRDGQWLQGPLRGRQPGRAQGQVRENRWRFLRRRRPVVAAALRQRQPERQHGRAEHLRRPDPRLAVARSSHPCLRLSLHRGVLPQW